MNLPNTIKKAGLVLLIPLVLIVLIEGILRWKNVGHDSGAFVSSSLNGKPAWTGNPFFTYRFFSPPLARLPATILVEQNKPANNLRIVVLGESAAQGDPEPAFGMPRLLEILLQEGSPGASIEVINAAITAISSPVITEIFRDVPKLQPDVVIIYAGNNEVIGPFGPSSAMFSWLPFDWMQSAAVYLSRFRIVQGLNTAVAMAAELRGPVYFGGVGATLDHPVFFDDPRLITLRRRYRKNLEKIVEMAEAAGIPVLLCTVAVNMADCPPTVSRNRPSLIGEPRRQWEEFVASGIAACSVGHHEQALEYFTSALYLDDEHAGLVYRIADCLLSLGRDDEAGLGFIRALELDGFRYRADSAINEIVRDTAARNPGTVTLVDVDQLFRAQGLQRDRDFFVDHVHFTFDGNALLARHLAETLIQHPRISSDVANLGELPFEELQRRALFTPLDQQLLAQKMTTRLSQPPFDQQSGVEERIGGNTTSLKRAASVWRG